jgi:hypothetical protein
MARARAMLDKPIQVEAGTVVVVDHRPK